MNTLYGTDCINTEDYTAKKESPMFELNTQEHSMSSMCYPRCYTRHAVVLFLPKY